MLKSKRFLTIGTAVWAAIALLWAAIPADASAAPRVDVIPIHDDIEPGLFHFIEQSIKKAEANESELIVFDIKTFGGRVDAAISIRDAIIATKIKTVAFINNRAISAGALISLACQTIAMTKGSTIGAATPIQLEGQEAKPVGEKFTSYLRAEFRSTAEQTNRCTRCAEAMVDAEIEIVGLIAKDKLLTMTATEATNRKWKMADFITPDLTGVLTRLKIDSPTIVRHKESWSERIVRFLTNPFVAGLLMSIGMLGILLELYSPGFGAKGIVGVSFILLHFFGHHLAGLAGWEELLLLLAGVLLLGLEVFVIPGFGLAGIAGFFCIFAGLTLTLINLKVPLTLPRLVFPTSIVASSMVVTIALAMLTVKLALITPQGRRLVLDATSATGTGQAEDIVDWSLLVGHLGIASTMLRPAGRAKIDGKSHDVVTEGGFVEKSMPVKVVKVEGNRIIVRKTDDAAI